MKGGGAQNAGSTHDQRCDAHIKRALDQAGLRANTGLRLIDSPEE
jgi:hypothetical protein